MILNKYNTFDEYLVAIRNLSQNILIPSENKLTHKNGIPEDLTNILRRVVYLEYPLQRNMVD